MVFLRVLILAVLMSLVTPGLSAHAADNKAPANSFDSGFDDEGWDDWGSPAPPQPFQGGIPGFSKKNDQKDGSQDGQGVDDSGSGLPASNTPARFGQVDGKLHFRIVRDGDDSEDDRHRNHYHRKIR